MSNHDGFCVDPKLICLQANTPEFIFSISHALIVIIPLDLKTLKHLLGDVFFSLLSTWKGQRDSGCTSFSSMDVWEPMGASPGTSWPRPLWVGASNVMRFLPRDRTVVVGEWNLAKLTNCLCWVDFEEIHPHPISKVERVQARKVARSKTASSCAWDLWLLKLVPL